MQADSIPRVAIPHSFWHAGLGFFDPKKSRAQFLRAKDPHASCTGKRLNPRIFQRILLPD